MRYEAALYKGDTLEVMSKFADRSIDMILCDLPYGTTACKWDTVIPFEPLWEQYKRIIKPNGAIVLFASQPFTSALVMSNPKWFKHEWVWQKNCGSNFANLKHNPFKEHENVLVFSAGVLTFTPIMQDRSESGKKMVANCKYEGKGGGDAIGGALASDKAKRDPDVRHPSSVQKFNRQVGHHPTQKPVALCEYLIKTYTNESALVLDNTMGSGTTGVACMRTKRYFTGIERDDKYFTIAEQRIDAAVWGDAVDSAVKVLHNAPL